MSIDQRLPELLDRQAQRGSAVRPSMDGVRAAVHHRAQRRRRHQVVGGIAAVVVLGALAAAAVAVTRDGGTTEQGVIATPTADVPLLGTDLPGWELQRAEPEVADPSTAPQPVDSVVFRPVGSDDVEPAVLVITTDDVFGDVLNGDPIDLGRDVTGRLTTGPGGSAVSWPDPDGHLVAVAGFGLPPEDAIIEAEHLAAGPVDVTTIDPPEGYAPGLIATFPPEPGEAFRRSTYANGSSTLTIETTNQPNWLELFLIASPGDFPLDAITPAADNPAGPGDAVVRADDAEALWTTPEGVTVHLLADGNEAGVVRQLVEQGGLIELDPSGAIVEEPTATTDFGTMAVVVDVRRSRNTVELEFGAGTASVTDARIANFPCGDVTATTAESRWLVIELDRAVVGEDGPHTSPSGASWVLCDHATAQASVAVALDGLPQEGSVTWASVDPSTVAFDLGDAVPVSPIADTAITDVRVGDNGDFDRVVIEFAGALPERHDVELSDQPNLGDCGTGTVEEAPAYVNVVLAVTPTEGPPAYATVISGPDGGHIQSVEMTCGFEGYVNFVIPLDASVEPVVTTLDGPPRLVIDIPR
jgi:hypothetical protein